MVNMNKSKRSAAKKSSSHAPATLPDRRQRRSADIRERLFRAALKLFAEKGFAETTVEDITNAADVGKGTFFNYFPSKDHILIAFSEMQISGSFLPVLAARRFQKSDRGLANEAAAGRANRRTKARPVPRAQYFGVIPRL
jgi:AcrR family transcriptional regulator